MPRNLRETDRCAARYLYTTNNPSSLKKGDLLYKKKTAFPKMYIQGSRLFGVVRFAIVFGSA